MRALAILVLLAAPVLAQDGLAHRVPAGTLVLFEADDLGGDAWWRENTAVGRICAEPEVQRFWTNFVDGLRAGADPARGGINPLGVVGLSLQDFEGIDVSRFGFALVDAGMRDRPFFDAALTVEFRAGGDKAAVIVERLRNAAAAFLEMPFEDLGGGVWRAASPEMELYFAADAAGVTLATTRERLDAVRAGPAAEPLAATARFGTLVERMGAQQRALFLYADVPAIYECVFAVMARHQSPEHAENVARIWRELGLDAVEAVGFADIPGERGWRTELALTLRERRGLFSLPVGATPPQRFLDRVPMDALWFEADRVDLGAFADRAIELAKQVVPEFAADIDEGLAELDAYLGVALRAELLAALGDEWVTYAGAPPHGGLVPDVVGFVSVKDRAALEAALDKLLVRVRDIAAEEDVEITTRETEFRGTTIRWLEMVADGDEPTMIAPAWAFGEDYLVYALWPQSVKHALAGTGESLVRSRDYQHVREAVPEGAYTIGWVDTKRIAGWVYNTAVPLLQGVQGALNKELARRNLSVNFHELPHAAVILRHLTGLVYYGTAGEDVARFGYVSPFGAGALAAPVVALGAGVAAGMARPMRGVHIEPPPVPRRDLEMQRLAAEIAALEAEVQRLREEIRELEQR